LQPLTILTKYFIQKKKKISDNYQLDISFSLNSLTKSSTAVATSGWMAE